MSNLDSQPIIILISDLNQLSLILPQRQAMLSLIFRLHLLHKEIVSVFITYLLRALAHVQHPPHLPPPNWEPAALPDLPGIQQKTVVSQLPVEKDNSTVPLKRNVSQDELPVTLQSVTMTESVLEKNHVSVETVSTAQLKLTQQRKQMTKTSVASSEESKQCVAMTTSVTTNQVLVVSLQRNGTLLPTEVLEHVSSVTTPKHQVNSKPISINHTSHVLVMETAPRHTSSTRLLLRRHEVVPHQPVLIQTSKSQNSSLKQSAEPVRLTQMPTSQISQV